MSHRTQSMLTEITYNNKSTKAVRVASIKFDLFTEDEEDWPTVKEEYRRGG